MKLGKVVSPMFQKAFSKLATQELPLRAAFLIKGIAKQIQDEIKKYDDSRMEALKRLGTVKEDGKLEQDENQNVKLSPENMQKFTEELQGLLDVDVTISSIKISDLGSNAQLSAADASALEELIVE
jgi:hypothetical protein